MSEQPKKKVRKFAPKKSRPTIAKSSKKRPQVPVPKASVNQPESAPPPAVPAPPQPAPQEKKPLVGIPVTPQNTAQTPQSPTPISPTPKNPAPLPVNNDIQSDLPPIIPQPEPAAAVPPQQKENVIELSTSADTISEPAPNADLERTSQKKVLKGKPSNQTDPEELKDEVANYLEICDSCLSENNSPEDIIDVLHMLVMSLNFDVVTIALLDDKKENLSSQIEHRGYKNPPGQSVVECWEKALVKGEGLDWQVLMDLAGDNQSDVAYWIVQEELDSIGYVPIRDDKNIYGFIFVAAMENKTQSPLTSLLLDACGSRIGMAHSIKINNGGLPQSMLNITKEIKSQLSFIMGHVEMFRNALTMSQEELNQMIENCNKKIIKSTQMLDSMTTELNKD